jgi:hypothetical protein
MIFFLLLVMIGRYSMIKKLPPVTKGFKILEYKKRQPQKNHYQTSELEVVKIA